MRELLLPSLKKTRADKLSTLKHNPIEEFQASVYRSFDPNDNTLLRVPTNAFKCALRDVAVDMPGATKAAMGRLTQLENFNTQVYGIPHMLGSIVRMADQKRTPDVRFRAILPEWACEVAVTYVSNLVREPNIVNLMSAAGVIIGIGDWRAQKGSGNFGQFQIVGDHNQDAWQRIVDKQARAAQEHALNNPIYFDPETEDLVEWFKVEVKRRTEAPKVKPKSKNEEEEIEEMHAGAVTKRRKRRNGEARV
jgi:hypothetical protein